MSWDQLRLQIDRHLDLEELRTLCFDLGVDYDSLRGEGKAAQIRELIALLRRNNRIPQLIVALNVIRPHVQWSTIQLTDVNTVPAPRRQFGLWLGGGLVVLIALVGLALANRLPFFSPTNPLPTAEPTTVIPTNTVELLTNTAPPATDVPPTIVIPTVAVPTNAPEPPHAPPIENTFGTELYDEQVILLTVPSGGQEVLQVMELWSAPLGTTVSCASGFLAFTWMVRDPYPEGGEDLEFRRLIPQGGGRTEVFAQGSTGAATVGYCQEMTVSNTSLVEYRVEIRYASASGR